ncbi:MAG: pirin-like C-terminal cupin domain-containing protein, partial [Clostridia bacterium]
ERPFQEGELALFGNGDSIMVTAADRQSSRSPTLEVLLLGGQPIREPIFHWGPFVMNSHEEILQAFEDYRSGRMGIIPATTVDLQEAFRHDRDG